MLKLPLDSIKVVSTRQIISNEATCLEIDYWNI